jgi:dTDP-4-amino-4,6-dideoxygalactose transaminase
MNTAGNDRDDIIQVELIDLSRQYEAIREETGRAVGDVLSSQRFILDAQVASLEEGIASFCGVRHAIGVASGSDAILISLMALGIGPGDEVVTTPYTFFSTVSSITRLGARPVFVDIDPLTYNIDPAGVRNALSGRTKAILAVHLYGQMCEMQPILEEAGKRGIPVVEDACQAIGSEYHGRRAGSMGRIGCFSFYPTKNLGGYGDGGMIVTDETFLAEQAKLLRVHGSGGGYIHTVTGINSRLDELQAAVLSVKLRYLEEWNERRRAHAAYYDGELGGIGGIDVPRAGAGQYHTYHLYVIRAARRDGLREFLRGRGVGSGVYYPVPLHLQECFASLGGNAGDFPEAERAARETLAIPVYAELTDREREYVAGCIREFHRDAGEVPRR